MICSAMKLTKFRIYVRLVDFNPILYFSLPANYLNVTFWLHLEDQFAVRFDEMEDPEETLIGVLSSINEHLDGIELIYVGNDNTREAA